MPRHRDPNRLRKLAETATQVFIAHGYRRTQVADVARAMGVAKGTVYLYVESKEALFELALRASAADWQVPASLPIPTPAPEALASYAVARLARDARFPLLGAAVGSEPPADVAAEVRSILEEMFDTLREHRVVIKLVDRCASDLPELSEAFYGVARTALPTLISQYVSSRQAAGVFRPLRDADIVARTLLEALTFWAIHHHWDPSPSPIDPDNVRETVVALLAGGLLS